jgi:hypothetical protein
MLESVRHYERRPIVEGKRGRPRRWRREDVSVVSEKLEKSLERKTEGRVSAASFISLYLPILRYPTDVTDRLIAGDVNIREAAYLARLTPERLKCAPREARYMRAELLKAHLLTNGSQESLRRRVKATLGEISEGELSMWKGKSGRAKADAMLDKNPYDARHLFYEEIQHLIEAMYEIGPEDLKDNTLIEFLRQLDRLQTLLRRVKRHRRLPQQR